MKPVLRLRRSRPDHSGRRPLDLRGLTSSDLPRPARHPSAGQDGGESGAHEQSDEGTATEDVEETWRIRPKLEDWPTGRAKYETFGGPEGEHKYDDGPEAKLGPAGLTHHEDGSVSIDGEKVDNPKDYKGDPIPGGPTDPAAEELAGEKKG